MGWGVFVRGDLTVDAGDGSVQIIMARPRTIQSPDEFDMLVDLYVAHSKEENEPLCITGLCLYLGFCSKSSLGDYGEREEFSASVKRARLLVENSYVKSTLNGGGAGPIFLLKASYNYVDKQVVEATGTLTVKIEGKDAQA